MGSKANLYSDRDRNGAAAQHKRFLHLLIDGGNISLYSYSLSRQADGQASMKAKRNM